MSRVEPSQTGKTAPQRCPVNLSWNLHKTLKGSIPGVVRQTAFNLFQANKPPPDQPRTQPPIPIPIEPRPAPGPLAHLDNGGNTEEQTHLPNETHLSGPVDSPPTEVRPASVAAHKPAARAVSFHVSIAYRQSRELNGRHRYIQSSGKRTSTTTSKSNRRCHKGAKGDGIEVHGPLPSLPHPIVPSHQAMPSPHLRRSSYLAHRSQRTRRRGDGGPIDLDSDLRRLTPQEGDFGRRRLRDKQQILIDTLKQLKLIEEALPQRRNHASSRVSKTNAIGDVFVHQRGLETGSAQSGAGYAPRTRLQHFNATAVYPTFSERQRHGGLIPVQVFGAQDERQRFGMTSLHLSAERGQRARDMRSTGARNLPAAGFPCHNAYAAVAVEREATSFEPAPHPRAHAHAAADSRLVIATYLPTFHHDPAPSVRPGQTGFDEHDDVSADIPTGHLAHVKSTAVLADVECGEIHSADSCVAEFFASTDGVVSCDMPVVDTSLESQADCEGTYHAPHASNTPTTDVGWWRSVVSPASPMSTSIIDSELHGAPYKEPPIRVSTYSSLDGAVSGYTSFFTHTS
ncbi:hypothetical protein VTO73DRAFT_8564 [Trametes versicolor]